MQGLIVKLNRAHLVSQTRLWGIITGMGAALPPVQDYLGRITWLICVAQLTFNGMPKVQQESGGMGMSFGGGGHRKVAFALGFSTWIVGALITAASKWAKAQRWSGAAAFTLQNMVFWVVSAYVQPYKG